jgi:hypothetical protein
MGKGKNTPAHDAGSKPAPVRAKVDSSSKTGAPHKSGAKLATKPAAAGAKAVAKTTGGGKLPKTAAANVAGVDTSNAAAAAARFLAAGLGKKQKPPGAAGSHPPSQSALFKQIKSGANHPVEKQLGGFLDRTTPAGTKRLDQEHGRGGPQGHNQTIGTDASRVNVPRRTGG